MKTRLMIAAALIAGMMIAPAAAVDFAAPITQMDGKPFADQQGKTIDTTLGSVAETALLSVFPDEQNLDGKEKARRFWLAKKLRVEPGDKAKNVELSAEEIALVKQLIAKAFGPVIVGQAWMLLDPTTQPK